MLSRTTARSLMSMASLSTARKTSSSFLMCQRCLSWRTLSCASLDLSSLLSDFLFPRSSRSASNWSSWSFSLWMVSVNQSWYFIFSASSSSSSSALARAHVENALVFSSRSKSLNLCMSFSIRLRASSSLSFELLWTPLCAIHSRICARSLCSLLMDLFSSSPSFSFCWLLLAAVACSQYSANSPMPSSTFFRTLSISFCNFLAAAAVITPEAFATECSAQSSCLEGDRTTR
mmetsp:Transcript_24915/g.74308  ORF Transcript_24915/g.74308 Transcript_24915/m.74308 type:complete len:232 (-) Transcript_24915:59-754(-)